MSHNNSYGNYAGTYQDQCLPNITGNIAGTFDDHFDGASWSGALSLKNHNRQNAWGSMTGTYRDLSFDASRVGTYRNNCNHVTPYNYNVYMWIRTN